MHKLFFGPFFRTHGEIYKILLKGESHPYYEQAKKRAKNFIEFESRHSENEIRFVFTPIERRSVNPHTQKPNYKKKEKRWLFESQTGERQIIEYGNFKSFCLKNGLSPSTMTRIATGYQYSNQTKNYNGRYHRGWTVKYT